MSVSVILMTYLRPGNLWPQYEAVRSQTVDVDQIIIGHLHGEKTDQFNFPDEQIVHFHQDPGMRSKFITALQAQSDFVAVLDDDVIPGKRLIENCLESFKKKPGLYGGLGFQVREGMYDEHCAGREEPPRGQHGDIQRVDYIGQSWFFPYEYLQHYFKERPPIDVKSGSDDIWFSFKCWEEAGIRSYVPPHPPDQKELWFARQMNPVSPEVAFCRRYEDHHEEREELIRLCRDRGWELLMDE